MDGLFTDRAISNSMQMRGSSPFKVMFVVLVIAIGGTATLVGVFLSSHPYFSPFQTVALPQGWIDQGTYLSQNHSIKEGEDVKDIFAYAGGGGKSIIILAIQPLAVAEKGDIEIKFNGISLGETSIENTQVINTSIASCCFVTLVQAGMDNVVEIESLGYEGDFRYLIMIPSMGGGL
jgi:hypothetical protein